MTEEISQLAFDAAAAMNDRIQELLELARLQQSLAQKLRVLDEVRMLQRDRRRLLGLET